MRAFQARALEFWHDETSGVPEAERGTTGYFFKRLELRDDTKPEGDEDADDGDGANAPEPIAAAA